MKKPRRVTRPLLAAASLLAVGGCASVASREAEAPALVARAAASIPTGMQWLYGSGEGAAASIQSYRAFRDYVLAAAKRRPSSSAVLAAEATLAEPRFIPCGNKPLAVILDVDETAIQNLGYEYDEAAKGRGFDAAIWDRWEKTGAGKIVPMPGAIEALQAIRKANVTVIFNSNRKAENAPQTVAALMGAGFGPVKHGETLFLAGDDASASAKDGRRARIAQRHCVVAMAGDQLGDFSDLFNERVLSVPARRRFAASGIMAAKWGAGWFMLSNPVYGPSIRGGFDDVFPVDKRWSDPGAEKP